MNMQMLSKVLTLKLYKFLVRQVEWFGFCVLYHRARNLQVFIDQGVC